MKEQTRKMLFVAIVEDDEIQRNSLRWLIENSGEFSCTGAYASCEEALTGIRDTPPDVVLMDIDLQGRSGIQCVRLIKNEFPEIHIIMQTVYSDDEKIFESLRAGAVGYLLKKAPTKNLLQAIREAYEGGAPMTGEVARKVLHHFQQPKHSSVDELLSERETEVLQQLIRGHSYQAIAEKLFVSVNTIRFHIKNIYEKLHVKSRHEVIAKAMKENIM